MKVKIYERKGNKAQHPTLRAATQFFAAQLLSPQETEDLLVKVKRVHCKNSISTRAGGECLGGGWGDSRENTDERIKMRMPPDRGFQTAPKVCQSRDSEGHLVITLRNASQRGFFSSSLNSQLKVLAHEMVHVAQAVTGRMKTLLACHEYEDDNGRTCMATGPIYTEWMGEVRKGGASTRGDWSAGEWGAYAELPWEIEAKAMENDLFNRFVAHALSGAEGEQIKRRVHYWTTDPDNHPPGGEAVACGDGFTDKWQERREALREHDHLH